MKVAKVGYPINFKPNSRLRADIQIDFVEFGEEVVLSIDASLNEVVGEVIHRYYGMKPQNPLFALPHSNAGEGVEMESIGARIMLDEKLGSYPDFFTRTKRAKILVIPNDLATYDELSMIEFTESLTEKTTERPPVLSAFDDLMREIEKNNIPRVVLLLNGKTFTAPQKQRAIAAASSEPMKAQLRSRMKVPELSEDEKEKLNGKLRVASKNGRLNNVRRYIEQGAKVNDLRESTQMTALMLAAENGHLDVVNELLEAGADVNIIGDEDYGNDINKSALMLAVQRNRTEIVERLIEAGADVNQKDEEGNPVLSYTRKLDMIQRLLKAGADPNVEEEGEPILFYNLYQDDPRVVEILLLAGADINAKDDGNRTVLEMRDLEPQITSVLQEWAALSDDERQRRVNEWRAANVRQSN